MDSASNACAMTRPRSTKRPQASANLAELRERIDKINVTLVDLLSERAEIALAVGRLKHADGVPIHQPARERAVLESVTRHNSGPLTNAHLERIFTEIISACMALEQTVRIAYLGPEHTYSHEAARGRFGESAEFASESSIAGVFQAVETGRAEYGVAPVENSTEGSVGLTLDLLIDANAVIVGEILLPIRHALMSREGNPAGVQRIVTHQQSLGQCRNYLATNYPHCDLEAVASNALAAQIAADNPECAAICSAAAAPAYRLKMIAENIQDVAHNVTRFLVLGRQPAGRSGTDKTSLMFALPERAGVLHGALARFAKEKINMTMIQSRPQRQRPWAYLFFVDLEGHREDAHVKRALKALERLTLFLKVLGSYPEGRLASA
jgi:chorismate mutase/prephenate dehydratase